MKIKMLALSILFAIASVQAEAEVIQECTYGGLPDKSVKIMHLAALKKQFYNSSPLIKDLLDKTMLLEKLAKRSIHLMDLSMQLTFAHIEYYTLNPDLDDAARKALRDSYAEIVEKLLANNPEAAELLICYKKEKDEELGIHVVKVFVEGQGYIDIVVGKTSTLKDGDHVTLAPQSAE